MNKIDSVFFISRIFVFYNFKSDVCLSFISGVDGSPTTTLVAGSTFTITWHLAYSHRVSPQYNMIILLGSN